MLGLQTLELMGRARSRWRIFGWILFALLALQAHALGAAGYGIQSVTSVSSINQGQSITITAKVTGNGADTTISFSDSSTGLIASCNQTVTSNGDKICTYTPTGSGSRSVTATLGTNVSGSATFTIVVPSLTLQPSSLSGGTVGIPYSATITASGGPSPTFSVTSGSLPNGLLLSSGGALAGTPTTAGTFNFVVTATSGTITGTQSYSIIVAKGSSTTGLTALPASVSFGDVVTLAATVLPSAATGIVTFYDGGTSLGSAPLSNGNASITVSNLSVATHSLSAVYAGDSNFNGSQSASSSVIVNKLTTSTSLAVSNTAPVVGANVTFTATVTGSTSGNVLFKDAGTTIGTVALSGSSIAVLTTNALTVGPHSITAEYQGDATHLASVSATSNVNVSKMPTTTNLIASATTADIGTTITFTATVSPTATGSVQFKDGLTSLGSVNLNNSSVATFSTNALSVGSHQITAVYQGDPLHDGSTSPVVAVSINLIVTSTSVSASATTITYPSSVTLTANVSPSSSTGNVIFKDGSTVLGTVALSNGSATLTVSSLAPGGHSITAAYSGDTTHASSTSAVIVITAKRPDPSLDANVRGILSSQVQAVQRFATAQIGNVQQRLEQLHSDDVAPVSFGMGMVALDQSCRSSLDLACTTGNPGQRTMAYAAQEKSGSKIFSAFDHPDPASAPMPFGNPREYSAFSIWSAGAVMFGHESLLGQAVDNRFSASGLSVGFDTRLWPAFKLGVAFGFGMDRTDIANSFAFNRGNSTSATLYASWRVLGSIFLDGLVGYGRASFTTGRPAALDGSWITGDRDARMTYGSLILTSEHMLNQMKFAPYTRLDVIHANLKAYTEHGPTDWVLSYGDANKTSTSAVVGLRAQYDWLIGNGNIISPIARLEYSRLFGGSLTQSIYYAADPSSQYGISLAPAATNTIAGSFGVKASGTNGVSGQLEYLLSGSTEGGVRGQGLRGLFKVAF